MVPSHYGNRRMTKMSEDQVMRAADLHYAYQHGQDAAKGDATAEPEFKEKFAGDAEAEREYKRGLAEQQARQLGVPKSVH